MTGVVVTCQIMCYNIKYGGVMKLREELSSILKKCKEESGMTYEDIKIETGCSITSIRYALNGGENVGVDVFQKLLDCFGKDVGLVCLKTPLEDELIGRET